MQTNHNGIRVSKMGYYSGVWQIAQRAIPFVPLYGAKNF